MIQTKKLAYLPTPLEFLPYLSEMYQKKIYIKRDDMTGLELSGNKVRKLEYLLHDAVEQGCDTILTFGGAQSNHARATAVAARKLGLDCILILDGTYKNLNEGNLFFDRLVGADIYFDADAETIIQTYEAKGKKVYSIPVGGSNALGSLGYVDAATELLEQLTAQQIKADAIVTTIGSGGTYAGLLYGLKQSGFEGEVIAVNISRDAASYEQIVSQLLADIDRLLQQQTNYSDCMRILDGYVGEGYAQTSPAVMAFMHDFAKLTGILLDPVYTGKAFYGFFDSLQKGQFHHAETIVLLHTGGVFGYREDQRALLPFNRTNA